MQLSNGIKNKHIALPENSSLNMRVQAKTNWKIQTKNYVIRRHIMGRFTGSLKEGYQLATYIDDDWLGNEYWYWAIGAKGFV